MGIVKIIIFILALLASFILGGFVFLNSANIKQTDIQQSVETPSDVAAQVITKGISTPLPKTTIIGQIIDVQRNTFIVKDENITRSIILTPRTVVKTVKENNGAVEITSGKYADIREKMFVVAKTQEDLALFMDAIASEILYSTEQFVLEKANAEKAR